MEVKPFYANAVTVQLSDDEALLILKLGWPDSPPDQGQEVCRLYVPRNLLRTMMTEWPSKIAAALEGFKQESTEHPIKGEGVD